MSRSRIKPYIEIRRKCLSSHLELIAVAYTCSFKLFITDFDSIKFFMFWHKQVQIERICVNMNCLFLVFMFQHVGQWLLESEHFSPLSFIFQLTKFYHSTSTFEFEMRQYVQTNRLQKSSWTHNVTGGLYLLAFFSLKACKCSKTWFLLGSLP